MFSNKSGNSLLHTMNVGQLETRKLVESETSRAVQWFNFVAESA